MANFFDQFDVPDQERQAWQVATVQDSPPPAAKRANFFDEFDESLPAEERAASRALNKGGDRLDIELAKAQAKMDESSEKNIASPVAVQERGSIANSLGNGLSFGFSDEVLALPMAAVAKMAGSAPEGATFGEVYQGMRDSINADREAFAARNPKTAMAGEVGGALLTGGAGIAKAGASVLGQGSARLLPRLAVNTAVGATEGAIAGAGNADDGERLDGAVTGAFVGGAVGAVGGEAINAFQRSGAAKERIAAMLRSGSTDKQVAKYYLNGAGKVKTDRIAKEAIDRGMDEGTAAVVKGSSATDKQKMLKMLDIMEKSKKNKLYSVNNRPSDVAGESLMERVGYIKNVNQAAGRKLDRVAQSLKGQPVDYQKPVDQFLSDLQGMDVKIDPQTMKLDFQGSVLEGLPGPQRTINRVMLRMRATKTPDAFDLHRMKKFLDEGLDFDKSKGTGLTKRVEATLKSLRHNLDEALDTQFPEYNTVNTAYSETKNAVNMLQKGVGPSVNLSSDLADKSTGKALRKVLSNYSSRENLMDALEEVDRVAKTYSTKPSLSKEIGPFIGAGKTMPKFEDDLTAQILFADELDDIFGSNARTSFRSEVARGGKQAAKDAMTGNKAGIVSRAVDWAHDRAFPNSEEDQIRAIRQLLSSP